MLTAYRRSGLAQKTFAVQTGIGLSTLQCWLRKEAGAKNSGAAFVAVPNLFSAAPPTPTYRLQFPRGLILEVRPGFAPAELALLLQLVQPL